MCDELLYEKELFIIKDNDGAEIIYNNSSELQPVDDTTKEMWNKIRVPDYEEVKRELQNAGLKSGCDEKETENTY